jgi:hypothetical protein
MQTKLYYGFATLQTGPNEFTTHKGVFLANSEAEAEGFAVQWVRLNHPQSPIRVISMSPVPVDLIREAVGLSCGAAPIAEVEPDLLKAAKQAAILLQDDDHPAFVDATKMLRAAIAKAEAKVGDRLHGEQPHIGKDGAS